MKKVHPAIIQTRMRCEKKPKKKKGWVAPHESGFANFCLQAEKIPMLTPEEEELTLLAATAGNAEAKHKLIESNYRLVIFLAKKYMEMGLPLMDLVQEGNMGLMRAVETFQLGRGKFSSYAGLRIRAHIMRALSNQSRIIRMSVHHYSALYAIRKAELLLLVKLEREPTLIELSKQTRLSPAKIQEMQGRNYVNQSMVWIDKEIQTDEGDVMLHETLVDDQALDPVAIANRSSLGLLLDSVLGELKERDRRILQMRYGLAGQTIHSLQEIGNAFRVSKQCIQALQVKAIQKAKGKLTKVGSTRFRDIDLLQSYIHSPANV